MRRVCMLVACALFVLSLAGAQERSTKGNILSKKFSDDVELDGVDLNKQGDKAVLTFEDQFWGISVVDGKTLWTKKLDDDYDQKWLLVRWADNKIVTVPSLTALEWIDAESGNVVGSVKFPGEGIDDLMDKPAATTGVTDRIAVRRFGNIMVIPFEDQYQIVDLQKKRLVYESSEKLQDLKYYVWGNTILIGGLMDTVVVVDVIEGKVLYQQNMEDLKFDDKLFQPLIRYKDHAVLIFDDAFIMVNVATGKQVAQLEISARELETYEPLILQGRLHLLLQSEEDLTLIDVSSGKSIWKKGAEEDGFGHMVHAYPVEGQDILVTTSNANDDIHVRRINGTDGKLEWSTWIVRSEDEFDPGHYHNTSALAAAFSGNARTWFNSAISFARSYTLDSIGVQTFYSQRGIDSVGPYTDEEFMALLSVDCIHENADGAGLARFIGLQNNELVVISQGLVNKAWDGQVSENEADGEAVFRIDPKTGKINKVTPVAFTRNTEGTENLNLYHAYRPIRNAYGTSILGSQTLTFIRNDGTVDSLRFPANDEGLISLGVGYDYRVVLYEDMDDHYTIWKVVFSASGMAKQLVGYADEAKHISVFSDTLLTDVSLRFEGGVLYAYELQREVPKTWPSPLWTMNEDALEDLGIGDFEATATRNDVIGIHPHADHVLILGSDGIAFIGAKNGCKQVIPWDGWTPKQNIRRSLRLFEPMPGGYLFDLGPSAGVISQSGTCNAKLMAYKEDSPEDLSIVFSELSSRIVIINKSDNTIDIYSLGKP